MNCRMPYQNHRALRPACARDSNTSGSLGNRAMAWPIPARAPENLRQPDGVRRPDFKVGIAVQLDEIYRGAEQRGGFFRFRSPLFRRAVGAGFTARADNQVRSAAAATLARNHPAASEFDVV